MTLKQESAMMYIAEGKIKIPLKQMCGLEEKTEMDMKYCPERYQGGIVMLNYKISLPAINDVKEFVNILMTYDFDVDLVSGRYAVDAKSIMGIFSLDLSKPIELNAHTDEPGNLEKDLAKYIVK